MYNKRNLSITKDISGFCEIVINKLKYNTTMKTIKNKIILCVFFLLAYSTSIYAQSDTTYNYSSASIKDDEKGDEVKTLFGGRGSNGFMMGVGIDFTNLENPESLELDMKIGGIVSHSFALGGQGVAMLDMQVDRQIIGDTSTISMSGGYGGIFLQPIILPKFPVHISFPIMIGVGGVGINRSRSDIFLDWDNGLEGDAFLIFRPGVELGFNLVKFMRLNLGVHYRYLYGMNNIEGVKSNALDGFSGGMSLIFGKF